MAHAKFIWCLLIGAWILAWPAAAQVHTLELTLTGRAVPVDLYSPATASRGAVLLAHGFMRSRRNMGGHAAALAGAGWLAIVPELPYRTSSRDNARALVELIAGARAGALGVPIDKLVLVGFSAGGLATLLAAASPGVVGYIGLDPFDRPGGEGLVAARALRTPAVLLRGPSAFCNAYRISEPWSAALPTLVEERSIAHASHCDFESPSDRWCSLFCGATDPARQQEVRTALLAAVQRFLPQAGPQKATLVPGRDADARAR